MEITIDFKSLTKYLTNSPDYVRQALFDELKDRLHEKRHSCNLKPGARANKEEPSGRLGMLITRDPDTPASVLSRLANSKQPKVLEQVAAHLKTNEYTLALLSQSSFF